MKLGAFFFEILPLLAFFAGYQYFGLIVAAALSVGCGAVVLAIAWVRERRMAAFPLFSLAMSAAFTAVAWWGGDGFFIKISRPSSMAVRRCVAWWLACRTGDDAGVFRAPVLPDRRYLAAAGFRWGCFFLILAVANEIVWRGFSEADWVFYKTFIAAPASFAFMMAQLPLTLRGRLPSSETLSADEAQ